MGKHAVKKACRMKMMRKKGGGRWIRQDSQGGEVPHLKKKTTSQPSNTTITCKACKWAHQVNESGQHPPARHATSVRTFDTRWKYEEAESFSKRLREGDKESMKKAIHDQQRYVSSKVTSRAPAPTLGPQQKSSTHPPQNAPKLTPGFRMKGELVL